MASTIFSGNKIKALLPGLALGDNATIYSGNLNPLVDGFAASPGDAYLSTSTKALYIKQVGGDTTWNKVVSGISFTNKSVPYSDASGNLTEDNANFNYDSATKTLTLNGSIDRSGAGTLAIGSSNATIVNIGNAGATVNVQGTTYYENVTQLQVKDPLLTLNKGGAVGSASNSGIELEENNIITGYVETSADRNSWALKAPNTAGIATITPGAGGITLNQSSHDAVTLGTANGLSLATQQLSLAAASGATTGALTSADWTTFNNSASATSAATSANTVSTIVKRDGSGNFSAGTITASLTGTASGNVVKSTGDIAETSFSAANNQAVAADVTGFLFSNASVRSFEALVSVYVNATSPLYELFVIRGIQRAADWTTSITSTGDASGFTFTITNTGQIQYTSSNYAGFTAATVKFRALTTTV